MSGPDITVTLNRNRSRSHANTVRSSNNSASTSLSDEDSSGEGVHVSPSESQDYSDHYSELDQEYDWVEEDKNDLAPSESVSRSSASDHHQLAEQSLRHRPRREPSRIPRTHRPIRVHRSHHPASPESVGSHEEIYPAYGHDLPRQRPRSYYNWAPQAGGQSHQYAPGYASQGYNTYTPPNAVSQGQQLVPFSGAASQYSYPAYQHMGQSGQAGYFPPGQHGMHPTMGVPLNSQGGTPYGGSELMHQSSMPAGYFPYPTPGYHVPHPVAPSPVHYPQMYPSPPAHQTTPPLAQAATPAAPAAPAAPAEPPKPDPALEELKQMLLNQKAEQEAREAAAKKAEEEKAAMAEAEKKRADEIAAAAAEAAAKATTEAEKKAADKAAEEAAKAAEEAAKAKEEADAAMAAAVAAAAPPPPEEKKKPIKFKDAVGRKFSFPFHLCATWEGMEDLIKQAFIHVDIIGPHVAEGHYDLIGPNNEIILPAVWETVIEPDWTITMHMWPMPEPKPEEEATPIVDVPPPVPEAPPEDTKKNKGKKKPSKPTAMGSWFTGSRPKAKTAKAPKK